MIVHAYLPNESDPFHFDFPAVPDRLDIIQHGGEKYRVVEVIYNYDNKEVRLHVEKED